MSRPVLAFLMRLSLSWEPHIASRSWPPSPQQEVRPVDFFGMIPVTWEILSFIFSISHVAHDPVMSVPIRHADCLILRLWIVWARMVPTIVFGTRCSSGYDITLPQYTFYLWLMPWDCSLPNPLVKLGSAREARKSRWMTKDDGWMHITDSMTWRASPRCWVILWGSMLQSIGLQSRDTTEPTELNWQATVMLRRYSLASVLYIEVKVSSHGFSVLTRGDILWSCVISPGCTATPIGL